MLTSDPPGPQAPHCAPSHLQELQRRLAEASSASRRQQVKTGLAAPLLALRLLLGEPRVLILYLLAVLLWLGLWTAAVVFVAGHDQDWVAAWIGQAGPGWVDRWATGAARAGAYVLVWLATLAVASGLALPATSPVLTLLALAVERSLQGPGLAVSQGWRRLLGELLRGLGRSLAIALVQLAGSAGIVAAGWVLTLVVPPLGAVWSIAVGGVWNAACMATNTATFALENRDVALGAQCRLLIDNWQLWLAFGAVAQLIGWFPPAVALLVIAATALVWGLSQSAPSRAMLGQRVPAPPRGS